MKRKNFLKPDLDVLNFKTVDILTSSDGNVDLGGDVVTSPTNIPDYD